MSFDHEARRRALEAEDARTNPEYAVDVEYMSAHNARLRGISVDPNLPADARVGVMNHAPAFDPKYGRDDEDAPPGD